MSTGPKYDQAYIDEFALWADQQAADPCTRNGHTCRCPRPDIEAFIARLNAEHHDQEQTFRALFTRPEAPSIRERLAELDAVSGQIEPLLDQLDTTWRAVETDLGWRRSSR